MSTYSRSAKVTVKDFQDQVNDWNSKLVDIVTGPTDAKFENNKLILTGNDKRLFNAAIKYELDLNENAQIQLGNKIGFPASWVFSDKCPDDLRAEIINRKAQVFSDNDYLWRIRNDNTLRAVLSDRYSVYDHADLVNAMVTAFDQSGLAELAPIVFRPTISDRMSGYILFETVNADPNKGLPDSHDTRGSGGIHPAIFFSNGEDGTASIRMSGGMYRSYCENGTIFGWKAESTMRTRHLFRSKQEMTYTVNQAIIESMKMTEIGIDAYIKAATIQIQTEVIPVMVERWKNKYDFSEDISNTLLANMNIFASRKPISLADSINILTDISGTVENSKTREDLEAAAGSILIASNNQANR